MAVLGAAAVSYERGNPVPHSLQSLSARAGSHGLVRGTVPKLVV